MTPALQSYFSMLISESKNITVVVDNAHIPLGDDYLFSDRDSNNTERFSRSLSALNTLCFPPPFLADEGSCSSRWDSIEGSMRRRRTCTESDFTLPHKPSRTQDEYYCKKPEHDTTARTQQHQYLDKTFHHRTTISPVPTKKSKKKRLLKKFPGGGPSCRSYSSLHLPSHSLDSTTQWLFELPLGVGDLSPRGQQGGVKKDKKSSRSTQRRMEEESPTLPLCKPQRATIEVAKQEEVVGEDSSVNDTSSEASSIGNLLAVDEEGWYDPTACIQEEAGSQVVKELSDHYVNHAKSTSSTSHLQQQKLAPHEDETPKQIFERSSDRSRRGVPPASFMVQFPFSTLTSPIAPIRGRNPHQEVSPTSVLWNHPVSPTTADASPKRRSLVVNRAAEIGAADGIIGRTGRLVLADYNK